MATTHSGRSSSMRPSTSTFARVGACVLLISSLLLTGRAISEVRAADPSFVTRAGSQLLLDGQPYRFVGMNIYGANSDGWCGEDYTADQLRTALDGIGSRNTVLRSWFFQTLAAAKGPDGAWTGARDWTKFDQTLAIAAEKGVHVIVTLTDQWGECGDGGDSGFKTKAWYLGGYDAPDPILAAKYDQWLSYRAWVVEIVTRYKDDPTILAWQLINEGEVKDSLNAGCPIGNPADPMDHGNILRDFAQDISGMIRGIDPNHLISLGTMGGGQCGTQDWQYSLVHALPNIDMCEYHDYLHEVMPGDQWNGLQVRIDQCAALDKPIFVGESGITPNTIPGGTFEDRAELYDAKFRTQFAAGVQGELVWAYRRTGSTLNTFDIGDGDPTLLRLQAWSTGCDPNDYRIAYTKEPRGGAGSADLYLLDPVTGAQRRVTVDIDHGERQVAWSPDGQRLAYLSNGGSFIYRTDLRTVNVDGSGVSHLTGSNVAPAFEPAWSPDGTRIAYVGAGGTLPQVALINPDGSGPTPIGPPPFEEAQSSPSWSPDGSRIAYLAGWNGLGHIKTMRSDGTDQATVISGDGISRVTWSPDGSRFAFTRSEFNNGEWRAEIYVMNADGTDQVKLTGALSNDAFYQFSRLAWSRADRLLFSSSDRNGHSDIYEMNTDGTGLANLTNTPDVDEVDPAWRPTRVPPVICSPEPPPPTAPEPPLNVTAVAAGPGSATVTWDPPASDGGAELLDYRIFADGTSVGGVTASLTSETVVGLPAGSHTFTVRTQNVVGESAQSAPSNAVTIAPVGTPPAAPSNVTAAAGDGMASVTWLAPSSDGGSPITGYTVTASAGPPASPGPGGSPGPGPSAPPGNPATTTTVGGLTNGTTYTFTVTATNDFGTSPDSNPSAAVTPQTGAPAPQATTATIPTAGGTATTDPLATGPSPANPITTSVIVPATAGGGSVTIAETAIGAAPAGYVFFGQQVEIVSTAATDPSNPLVLVFGIDPTFVPADIFRDGVLVRAPCNPAGTATPSPCIASGAGTAQVTVLTAEASQWNFGLATSTPGPPTNVAATRGDRQASVSWSAPAFNRGSPITSYTVTSTPGGKTSTVSGTTTSAIVSGLSNGTTYTFKVVATNSIGSGPPSAPSNAVIPAPKTNQAITFAAISNKILTQSPVTVSPTASSGLPVTLTTTSPSSICTMSGTTITLVGTGSCTIVASQAGNAVYNAAPSVTRTFTILKAPQTITFANPGAKTMIQRPLTVSATTTSPLTVTLTSTTVSVCTVSGMTIAFVGTGSCTIVASQAGDSTWAAAASVTRTFTISKASQTITFANPGAKTMIQSPQTVSATTTSPLTVTLTSTTLSVCTVSGMTIAFVATGPCTLVASQAGDANWAAAPSVARTFTISKAPQTITFANPGPQSMLVPMVLVSPTASSGLSVMLTSSTKAVCTVSSTTITLLKPGTCKITAAQAGNAVYKAAAAVLQTFTVTLAAPLSLVVANGTGMSGPNR